MIHELESLENLPLNFHIQELIRNVYLKNLNCCFDEKLRKLSEELKGIFQTKRDHEIVKTFKFQGEALSEELRYHIEKIENDIDIRIESVIDELHKLRETLKNELKEMKEKFQVSELMKNLAETRIVLEEIKGYIEI